MNPEVTNCPLTLIVQVAAVTMLGTAGDCDNGRHGPASAVLKLMPVMETCVLIGPLLGVRVIVGVFTVTVNAAVATSSVDPVTVTAYVPGRAVAAIVNPLAVNTPVEEIVQVVAEIMMGVDGD